MDPDTAFKQMSDHFNAGGYAEARDLADELIRSARAGGTLPPEFKDDRRAVILTCKGMIAVCNMRIVAQP